MPYTDMWEIQDNNGTIHSGTEEEMKEAFQVMQDDFTELSGLKDRREELSQKWNTSWAGDLKLVQIHDLYR
jgi:hypothetical protein